MQAISKEIMGYQFGNGTKANVIVAVPLYIQNENGEKIFLGFPEQNKRTAGQQYEEHCILDKICSKLKKIPPQFILGYYCENSDGRENFIKNGQHYSNLIPEDRENLFTELYSNMDDFSRNCNELINSGDIEGLKKIKEKFETMGMKPYMADNAISLAKKYKDEKENKKMNLKSAFERIKKSDIDKAKKK